MLHSTESMLYEQLIFFGTSAEQNYIKILLIYLGILEKPYWMLFLKQIYCKLQDTVFYLEGLSFLIRNTLC